MSDITPEAIVWHDGSLQSILLTADSILLAFGECFLYRPQGRDRYEVNACAAKLSLRAVRQLKIEGMIDPGATISDCRIVCSGEHAAPRTLLAGGGEGRLELTLTNGTWIGADFGDARLVLEPPLRFVEVWEGPLFSSS
jgi:hypothetical protein